MDMDVEIEGVRVDVRPEWRSDIEARVTGLHPGHDVTHVRVRLTTHDHRKPDDSKSALIVVQIPGHTTTAEKQHATFEEAIQDSFDALDVEIEKIREKRGLTRHRRHRPAGARRRHEVVSRGRVRLHCDR